MIREKELLNTIEINKITKDYGGGKGVFDISLSIDKGEIYGYLGSNGAGKTTTLRLLMGFIKPDSGVMYIEGMDKSRYMTGMACWSEVKTIHQRVGYLPGEISLPNDMTGTAYIELISKMRHMKDLSRPDCLADMLKLDTKMKIKRMSKGMKQKLGIITTFMHDPDIYLLDEPTSGLDPLMQNLFIELLEEEKSRGKTVILSSHNFGEVEKTCDRVGVIKSGKLIKEMDKKELQRSKSKTYTVGISNVSDYDMIHENFPEAVFSNGKKQVSLTVSDMEINKMLSVLAKCDVRYLRESVHTLEEYFMKFYGDNEHNDGM